MTGLDIKEKLVYVLVDNGIQVSLDDFDLPLNFDSLKYMELLILIEEKFDCELNEVDFINVETLNDIFLLIEKKSSER